jgi:hypothetical protein
MSGNQRNLFGGGAKPEVPVAPSKSEGQAKSTPAADNQERGLNSLAQVNPPVEVDQPVVGNAEGGADHSLGKCERCGEQKEVEWVNGGNLGPNQTLCRECLPQAYARYGYEAPGYRIREQETVEVFSQTTGWERIKTYWVKSLFIGIFENSLFPLCVHLQHEEVRAQSRCGLDHETLGITWACGRFLAARTGIPLPQRQGERVIED